MKGLRFALASGKIALNAVHVGSEPAGEALRSLKNTVRKISKKLGQRARVTF